MEDMTITYETVRAIIAFDTAHNTHTVFLEKAGGPIVSAATEGEAKAKFSDALNLSSAVRNSRFYAQAEQDAAQRDSIKSVNRTNMIKSNVAKPLIIIQYKRFRIE